MKVSEKTTFQDYWNDERFELKKPCRNGSQLKMLGDNIYHKNDKGEWIQEDSHHSNQDGTTNNVNLSRDTGSCDHVLISDFFYYFGDKAIAVDLASLNYSSGLGYKKISLNKSPEGRTVIQTIHSKNKNYLNFIVSNPCQFTDSHQRVDQGTSKIFE